MPPIVRGSGVTTKSMGRRMTMMMTLRLGRYGRETKRPVIGYGQRADNGQRADRSALEFG